MIKGTLPIVLSMALLGYFCPASADTTISTSETSSDTADLDTLVKYIYNLGTYLGYDLTNASSPFTNALLNYKSMSAESAGDAIGAIFFSALPVNTPGTTDFVTDTTYTALNQYANITFPSYGTSSTTTASIVPNFDVLPYQQDPVSQSILNILSTQDTSFCANYTGTSTTTQQTCVSQQAAMETALGDIMSSGRLPGTTSLYSTSTAPSVLSALNTNALIAPLVYSETSGSSTTSSNSTTSTAGLPNSTQELEASNFIRYAIGNLLEIQSIAYSDYDQLMQTAYPYPAPATATADQTKALTDLEAYLTGIRVYAAQSSVAISNLYYIFSKRVPQTNAVNSETTSQALTEYQMATWRLYNPSSSSTGSTTQWVDQINTASSATVQKEIAVLLSEINYQMYLTRQQEERLLLTNSLQLIQSMIATKPSPPTSSTNTTDTSS